MQLHFQAEWQFVLPLRFSAFETREKEHRFETERSEEEKERDRESRKEESRRHYQIMERMILVLTHNVKKQ